MSSNAHHPRASELAAPSSTIQQPRSQVSSSSTTQDDIAAITKNVSLPPHSRDTSSINTSSTHHHLEIAQPPRRTQTPAQAAALRGASLAFGKSKPPVGPKPAVPGANEQYSETNGALAAATRSIGGSSVVRRDDTGNGSGIGGGGTGGRTEVQRQRTGGSAAVSRQSTGMSERGGGVGRRDQSGNGRARLQIPGGTTHGGGAVKSASYIAASLAAERERSRSREVTPHSTGGGRGRQGLISREVTPHNTGLERQGQTMMSTKALREELNRTSSYTRSEGVGKTSVDSGRRLRIGNGNGTDTTPIPATTSLIQMFEQQNGVARSVGGKLDGVTPSGASAVQVKKPKAPLPAKTQQSPTSEKPQNPELKAPRPRARSPQGPPIPAKLSKEVAEPVIASQPSLIPPRPKSQTNIRQKNISPTSSSSSNDSFVSASSHRPSIRSTVQDQNRTHTRPPNRRHQSSSSVHSTSASTLAINSLANAIVASSIASSRAASPSKSILSLDQHHQHYGTKPPPPPPRLTRLFHKSPNPSRTPSPAKVPTLRTTMRKPPLPVRNTNHSKNPNLLKSHHHPHKHAEGSRHRYQTSIPPAIRKRYEALWASNRGLLFSPSSSSPNGGSEDSVCSLVVRDIWSRSRLPREVLEEVYELVDRGKTGWLEREEFVLGLWLIDGWLGGRKIPRRVGRGVL